MTTDIPDPVHPRKKKRRALFGMSPRARVRVGSGSLREELRDAVDVFVGVLWWGLGIVVGVLVGSVLGSMVADHYARWR